MHMMQKAGSVNVQPEMMNLIFRIRGPSNSTETIHMNEEKREKVRTNTGAPTPKRQAVPIFS